MRNHVALVMILVGMSCGALAAPPPVAHFARMPAVADVSISPDGRYLAYVASSGDIRAVMVQDRTGRTPDKTVFSTEDKHAYDIEWCGWANPTRVSCGLIAAVSADMESIGTHLPGERQKYAVSRLIAVNADGTQAKVLINNSFAGDAQFQDRILDWTPAAPETVLIQLDDDGDVYPSVFELDVYSGSLKLHTGEHQPIRRFVPDSRGGIRLGYGNRGPSTKVSSFARPAGETDWRRLTTVETFARAHTLLPYQIIPGTNHALALGDYEGRQALWELDLEDKQPPKMIFSQPQVDVDRAILTANGRMLGVEYETERPAAYFTDRRARNVIDAANQFLTQTFNAIHDLTLDEKVYVIRASSDVDAGTFHLLDVTTGKGELEQLGTGYPELSQAALGRMRSISYPARDGTMIPAYLTAPPGVAEKSLPLIVMPHGGPIERDSWEFDFVRAFLVSRGYAVLQMNFRGSAGYGWKWFHAAHQDWGGLTYSDIVDGARWVIAQGIADPKRVCIVGWSFGGYAALLGAVRDGELFRCAVSIAGISNLRELRLDAGRYFDTAVIREEIGSSEIKLIADSPVRHAKDVRIPVLLVHGEDDWNVGVEHSQDMAAALKRAGKPHELIVIKRGDHNLRWQSDRVSLLEALEKFLAANLGAGANADH